MDGERWREIPGYEGLYKVSDIQRSADNGASYREIGTRHRIRPETVAKIVNE